MSRICRRGGRVSPDVEFYDAKEASESVSTPCPSKQARLAPNKHSALKRKKPRPRRKERLWLTCMLHLPH